MRTLHFSMVVLPFVLAIGCAEASTSDELSTEDALASSANRQRDPAIDAARRADQIGEDTTGYLGFVDKAPTSELRAKVDDINLRRRAAYADLAERDRVTLDEVERTAACILLRDHIAVGEAYRAVDGTWAIRRDETPIVLPSFCDR